MVSFKEAIELDLKKYVEMGGVIKYPFPIEDFAIRVFGLDIQYENFDLIIDNNHYDPGEFFGMLFPNIDPVSGYEKVIYVNTNRKPFKLGDFKVPKEFYIDNADRQTITHEVGHYSDKYFHNTYHQESLFPELFVDDPASIVVYPKENETFANKYARHLLVPEFELINLINQNAIYGTPDLRNCAGLFTNHFGVTQFLIEIRLNELQIHFNNGVYIKKLNRTRDKEYTEKELHMLLEIGRKFNLEIDYYDSDSFVGLFNKLSGGTRASGPLYMAYKRLMEGEYDSKYPSLFEKRIKMLIDLELGSNDNDSNILKFKKSI